MPVAGAGFAAGTGFGFCVVAVAQCADAAGGAVTALLVAAFTTAPCAGAVAVAGVAAEAVAFVTDFNAWT